MRRILWTAALLLLASVAACTSSAAPSPGSTPASTPEGPTAPSTAPGTSAPVTSPSSSPVPLSRFENDPAVKALRAWAAEAARTVNAGHYDSAALDALMTAQLRATIKNILGNSVGYTYPGPLPFTPVAVPGTTATQRQVNARFVTNGYGVDPKTGKPHGAYKITPIRAGAQLTKGRWLVSLFTVGSFSCAGVKVPAVTA